MGSGWVEKDLSHPSLCIAIPVLEGEVLESSGSVIVAAAAAASRLMVSPLSLALVVAFG